jgi:integrase
MIQLQRLSGMRPGEVCIIRTCDLDTSGRTWIYTPETHKTEHHDKERPIYLGPHAQDVLRPWLRTELTAYLFSPKEVMAEKHAQQRENRKTPITPSQRGRKRKAEAQGPP